MVGGWIASYVFIFIFWSRCCCCCCLLLLLPTTSVLKRRQMLARSDSPQSRGPCARAGPPSPRPSRSASEVARSRHRVLPHAPQSQRPRAVFCDFSAARPRFVARLARSVSPQSRGPCPRAEPPSPRPSRSASELARSRPRGLPHAPYVFARTPVPIYCLLLLLSGLLPYLLPSNRLIILYSYHYTYHVLLVLRSKIYQV